MSLSTLPTRHLAATIARRPLDVYAFVHDLVHLPQWAAGLGGAVERVDGQWVVDSELGRLTVEFAPLNELGVLDHVVTLPSGQAFLNPMRVFPNGDGTEVVFTLFRQPDMSDEAFESDAAAIARDLATLKHLLEDQRLLEDQGDRP